VKDDRSDEPDETVVTPTTPEQAPPEQQPTEQQEPGNAA
jgi:hypothetical protein